MKKNQGTELYILLLLVAVVAVFSFDLYHHILERNPAVTPLHTHFSLSQLAVIIFCALFYLADRFRLFHLSLRLCFLSLFLVWARILFELQTGRFSAGNVESGLLLFVGIVLLGLARHPVRMLENRQIPS